MNEVEEEKAIIEANVEYERLVRLNSNNLAKMQVVTDSLLVAKEFGKRHDNVLKDIKVLIKQLNTALDKEQFSLLKFEESNYLNERGREYTKYNLNKRAFMMLVMGYTTTEAFKIKNKFLDEFELLEHVVLSHRDTRHIGVRSRKELTNSINCIPNHNSHAFSNYTDLINRKVLGISMWKYKEQHNIPKNAVSRDFLSKEQLEQIEFLESKVAGFIDYDKGVLSEKELFQKIKSYIEDFRF